MGRNEPKRVENRQQESYQVTHWTKRVEQCRTLCGVWWKGLVSIKPNPKTQREDWFILHINGPNANTTQDIGSRLSEPLWAGNAHWVTMGYPAYVSPSDASPMPSIITAYTCCLLPQHVCGHEALYHSHPLPLPNTAKATYLLLIHPPQQPHAYSHTNPLRLWSQAYTCFCTPATDTHLIPV